MGDGTGREREFWAERIDAFMHGQAIKPLNRCDFPESGESSGEDSAGVAKFMALYDRAFRDIAPRKVRYVYPDTPEEPE